MKYFLISLCIILFVSCDEKAEHGVVDRNETIEQDNIINKVFGNRSLKVKELFEDNCADCHGSRGADIKDIRLLPSAQFITAIRSGKKGMPTFNNQTINDTEIIELKLYVDSLTSQGRKNESNNSGNTKKCETPKQPEKTNPPPEESEEPKLPEEPEEPSPIELGTVLFNELCIRCHKPDGSGKASKLGIIKLDKIIFAVRNGDFEQFIMPQWTPEELSDEQAGYIKLYLDSLASPN